MTSWAEMHAPKTVKDVPVHASKLKAAREWLSRIGSGASSHLRVLVVGGASGVGKYSMIRLLCDEMDIAITEWNDNCVDDVKYGEENAGILWAEGTSDKSTPGVTSQYPSLQFESASSTTQVSRSFSSSRRILLLRDAELMTSLSRRLPLMHCPVVILMSGINSSTDMAYAVNQIIDKEAQAVLNLQQLYVTPVVKAKLQTILSNIADAEIVLHRNKHKIRLRKPPKELMEHICEASGGDVRQAIMQLQFVMLGQSSEGHDNMKSAKNNNMDSHIGSLDGLETIMHAALNTNCCLHKSPEEVLSRVDFPIDMSLSFLQHNCISHLEFISLRRQRKAAEKCTDEPLPEEDCLAAIERVLDFYCDAEVLWQRQFDSSQLVDLSDRVFPSSYVVGLCGRASAVAMHNPQYAEESRGKREFFLPMNRPKSLDVWQKQKQLRSNISHLRDAMAPANKQLLAYERVAVEIVPYLRTLVTDVVYNRIMPLRIRMCMQSIVFNTSYGCESDSRNNVDSVENNASASILEVDDISSFSDSD